MLLKIKTASAAGAIMLLAGCGMVDGRGDGRLPAPMAVRDYPVKIGRPYQIGGVTYTPADAPDYDEVGYASWYGGAHKGKPTANGEHFRPEGISAAHKTLPLPSYVEVTSLETGRTILVRINDRGPFVSGRVIDLSSAAAEQLGMKRKGVAAVRVRRVNPPERERAMLRAGRAVAERSEAPERLLRALRSRLANGGQPEKPVREASAVPSPDSRYVVQVGAFTSKANADALAQKIGAWVAGGNGLWQVRLGPYQGQLEARESVEHAAARGYPEAHILINDGV